MRLSYFLQSSSNQGLIVEFVRISLFIVVLGVGLITSITQGHFVNWTVLAPFLGILTAVFALHTIWVSVWSQLIQRSTLLFLGFVLDSVAISLLIYFFGINQSLFLFLHLINILLAGIFFRGVGALTLALITSIFFSTAVLFSYEIKALNFFFLLVLNNIAFFTMAGLAGYLSEQLQSIGSELKQTGLNLRSAQELNQVLIDNIPSGMASFTEQGEILRVNPSAQSILEKNDLMNLHWQDLFPEVSLQDKNFFKQDIKYKSFSDQETKILGLTVKKIFSPELQAYLYIALFDDLTKVRQLEFTARQNEKMAAVGGLAAGIAHEIRNPLTGISGSVEMLSQNTNNEDDRKLMRIILREINRLNNLITEFLEYSRPETPPTDKIDLGFVVNEVLEALKTDSKVRADVVQEKDLHSNLFILGKSDKLKQVFLNIILNAYQAMNDNASDKPLLIKVKGAVEEGRVKIIITDTGCGMSEATKKKMFEPFHTTKPKGTGLGLAVTHKILEGHGAQIFVESELGKGTEFTLTFPVAN